MEGKRDTSRKRESIIDGAIEAFRDEGYDTTSMDRIAEIAGASKRTVYNHFESKEALFQAVVARFMDEALSLKKVSYDPARPLKEQLMDFANAKLSMVSNSTWLGLLKVTLGVFIRNPDLAKATMEKSMCGEDSFILWLRAAQADNKLRFDNVELVAEMFWSLVSGALFWPQIFQEPLSNEAIQPIKDELIDLFLSRYGA